MCTKIEIKIDVVLNILHISDNQRILLKMLDYSMEYKWIEFKCVFSRHKSYSCLTNKNLSTLLMEIKYYFIPYQEIFKKDQYY